MGENEIYEAFGLEAPTSDTTDTSAGADDSTATVGDAADTAGDGAAGETTEVNTEVGEGTATTDTTATPENGTTQTPEQNSQFAAARRQAEAERDRAIAAEKARADAQIKDVISSLNIVSPYTGKLITTPEEYAAYKNAKAADFKKGFMEKNKLDEKGYDEFVAQLPEVVSARDAVAKAADAEKAAVKEKAKAGIAAELEIISKLDPDIKDMGALFKTENYPEILARVKSGMSLSDAYKLVNFDKLQQRSAAAEKQRALNSAAGKSHMTPTTQAHGQALAAVPEEVKQNYRLFNPNMSEEDMARDYNKYLKMIKK